VVVQVADNGPASWVEDNAAAKCGGGGDIIDTSPLVADYFGGGCGWSQCFWVEVRPLPKSMPQGICPTCPCGGECKPGEVQGQGCGNCGWQERSCGGDAKWGGWGPCNGQGPCAPGQDEASACGDCGTHSRVCGGNCQWTDWNICQGPDPGDGKLACDTGEPGICKAGVLKCLDGWVTCKRLAEPNVEVCDDMDNDCDGPIDEGEPQAMGPALPAFAARVEDFSFPMVLAPGEVGQGWVEFLNAGAQRWEKGQVWLRAEGGEPGSPSAVGVPREWPAWDVAAVLESDVDPGELARLQFAVASPTESGDLGVQRFLLLKPDGEPMRCPVPGFELAIRPVPGKGWWLEPPKEPESQVPALAEPDDESEVAPSNGGGCDAAGRPASLSWALLLLALPWLAARLRCRRDRCASSLPSGRGETHTTVAPATIDHRPSTIAIDRRTSGSCLVSTCLALALLVSAGCSSTPEGKPADVRLEQEVQASVLSVFPVSGTAQGNEEVVIAGTGFVEGMKVRLGDTDASPVTVLGPEELRVVTPPMIAGKLDVGVTWPTGEELTLPAAYEALRLELKFVDVPIYSFPGMPEMDTQAGAVGDVDKDGDIDVVLVSSGGPLLVLANDGNGNFEQVFPPLEEPFEPRYEDLGPVEGAESDVTQQPNGDVAPYPPPDITSPQDVPAAPGDSSVPQPLADALSGDAGAFDAAQDAGLQPSEVFTYDARDVVLADLDADGCLDAFISSGPAGNNALLRGTCDGRFEDLSAKHLPEDPGDFGKVTVADINGDGRPDLLVANRTEIPGPAGRNRLYLQKPEAALVFEEGAPDMLPLHEESSAALLTVDVDRDGDLDLVTANVSASDGVYLRLLLALPQGFVDAPTGRLPTPPGPVNHAVAGDVDGDGDQDIIAICAGGQDRVLRNDGTGYFFDDTLTTMPLDKAVGTYAVLRDLDRDGRPDLVVANSPHQDRLYLNSGNGTFHDYTPLLPIGQQPTNGALVLDVDSDHDLDLVLLNGAGTGNRLLLSVRPQGGGGR